MLRPTWKITLAAGRKRIEKMQTQPSTLCTQRRWLLPFLLGGFLVACQGQDTRLADDQQTCQRMGHLPDNPAFKQCLAELNERRCAVVSTKSGTRHQGTEQCTRLPTQP
jgi:hypothetical protein